jgi:hypothetical protein
MPFQVHAIFLPFFKKCGIPVNILKRPMPNTSLTHGNRITTPAHRAQFLPITHSIYLEMPAHAG